MNTTTDPNSFTSKIIRFSAHNKFLVLVMTAVILIASYYSLTHIPLDAIPDLSDTQVIVYSRWDRSPDIIEDQVTYPIITGTNTQAAEAINAAFLGFMRLRM